jgi:hypothetical protein
VAGSKTIASSNRPAPIIERFPSVMQSPGTLSSSLRYIFKKTPRSVLAKVLISHTRVLKAAERALLHEVLKLMRLSRPSMGLISGDRRPA